MRFGPVPWHGHDQLKRDYDRLARHFMPGTMIFGRRSKPVITLDETDLENAMCELWAKVDARGGAPDGIVGIATGGLRCAEKLIGRVPVPLYSCAMRRPATEIKRRPAIRRVLRALPYGISNWLRRVEDRQLEKADKNARSKAIIASAQLLEDVDAISRKVKERKQRHLVLIDDAVDSGATLGCVVATLRAALPPETMLTVAVLTQTRSKPAFLPDVVLYRETLCRFPWSFDFRGA